MRALRKQLPKGKFVVFLCGRALSFRYFNLQILLISSFDSSIDKPIARYSTLSSQVKSAHGVEIHKMYKGGPKIA